MSLLSGFPSRIQQLVAGIMAALHKSYVALFFRRICQQIFFSIKPISTIDEREPLLNHDLMAEIKEVLMKELDKDRCETLIERTASFASVIANMRLDRLPSMASNIRGKLDQTAGRSGSTKATHNIADRIPCNVCLVPLVGAFHILFPLDFVDGSRWILKVPETGYPDRFDDTAARALESEALTMQLLRLDTEIPVPEVFDFNASFDNELNVPFILMEFIPGIPLYECWFDKSCSKEKLEQRREQILQDVAKATLQLNKFTFDQGGAPVFGQEGDIVIGPLRIIDVQAMCKRTETDDPDNTAIFRELGPFMDWKSFICCLLDTTKQPADEYSQGVTKLLRLYIEWFPKEESMMKPGFVLTHPDLDIQNILVSKEGRLKSLIDWDGVAAVPRCLGNERYPSWLTRDWDPAKYGFVAEPEEGFEPGEEPGPDKPGDNEESEDPNENENSPEELAHYRAMYQQMIASCMAENESSRALPAKTDKESINAAVKLTRNSCVIESLYIAATDPLTTDLIVEKIFNEISEIDKKTLRQRRLNISEKVTEDGDEDYFAELEDKDKELYLGDITFALAVGNLDEGQLERLRVGFAELCS